MQSHFPRLVIAHRHLQEADSMFISRSHPIQEIACVARLHQPCRPGTISTTSGQASRAYIDCASCTTCSSDDPVAPDKAKCSSFSKIHLFIYFRHIQIHGAASLHYYNKYTRYSWLCHYFVTTNILGYLVNFFSSALDISTPAQ
jgi:hypothetical protein